MQSESQCREDSAFCRKLYLQSQRERKLVCFWSRRELWLTTIAALFSLRMYRELLISPPISSYRLFLLLAFVCGYFLARRSARQCGVERRHIDNILLLLPIFGLAGGRFFSRYFYYPEPLTFWQAMKVWEDGGLVFYGGMIFGILTVLIYAAVRRVPLFKLIDSLAPALALGLAFGRVGCFMAGCCWGDVCVKPETVQTISNPVSRFQVQTIPFVSGAGFPLAVQFPPEAGALEQHQALGLLPKEAVRSLPVHPVQLYEAFAVFILSIVLYRRLGRNKHEGEVFWMLGMSYGVIRFTLEFLRADSRPVYFGGTTISQTISIFLALTCLLFFIVRREWFARTPQGLIPIPISNR
jgi:phosphatidylglycerol:prolipoprotein diacylglycerol transferase